MKDFGNQARKGLLYSSVAASAIFGLVSLTESAIASQKQPFGSSSGANPLTAGVKSTPEGKTRVAVLDFEYSSVSNPNFLLSLFPPGSRGVSDILVGRLVQSNKYSVIERSKIDDIMREQDFGGSGRVDAASAAQIGRLLGVDMIVIGSVTQFDLQQRESGGGISLPFVGRVGGGSSDTDAYVKLNVRMVNTSTGEIVMAAEGNGNISQSDSNISIAGVSGGSSTSNETKLLTLATEQAIDDVVTQMGVGAGTLAAGSGVLPNAEARVAEVLGDSLILNKGAADGYRDGMQVSIERVAREVKDPETGEVLRQVTESVGTVELYDVDDKSSMGRIVSGSNFQVGDVAKPTE